MIRTEAGQRTVEAAVTDAGCAVAEFDDARRWLAAAVKKPLEPLAAEVWVTDPAFSHVLLVRHRWRGWVPPGGKVDWGETPREAAARELPEETGIRGQLLPLPAAVCVRAHRADWKPTLGLSYAAVVERSLPVTGENGQPAEWLPLEHDGEGMFPADRDRIRAHAGRLARTPVSGMGLMPKFSLVSATSRLRRNASAARLAACSRLHPFSTRYPPITACATVEELSVGHALELGPAVGQAAFGSVVGDDYLVRDDVSLARRKQSRRVMPAVRS